MTNNFDDAGALVQHAKASLARIRAAYAASLTSQQIAPTLLIDIKNFMENLRSALDFSAVGLFKKYGNGNANAKIYFPYALATQTNAQFAASNRIEACIPGISSSRPDVVLALLSVQHYFDPRWSWVPKFMDLNNENKHQRLTPQTRNETCHLKVSSPAGGSIIIEGSGSVSIRAGSSIDLGGAVIPGGQVIGVDNPGLVVGGTQEITVWVSFEFSTNHVPVLPFLENSLRGTEKIVQTLSAL